MTAPLFPEPPTVPDEQKAVGKLQLRYEDVSQDGRLLLPVLPNAYSGPMWGGLIGKHPAANAAREQGIIPILHRLVLVGQPGPFSVVRSFEARSRFDLAHALSPTGEVDRILLRVWGQLWAPHGSLFSPPAKDAPPSLAGESYAEHVFTRLFAPPDQRKVRSLEAVPGLPAVPGPQVPQPPPDSLLELPEGATPLDEALVEDPAPLAFSLGHTDSNQHVNSLVYPQLFEEAALRRLVAHGLPTALLARRCELAYRKPFFAGERARVFCRAFRLGDELGAVGVMVPDGSTPSSARPSCYVRLMWAR